jgi:hypothetical protein
MFATNGTYLEREREREKRSKKGKRTTHKY